METTVAILPSRAMSKISARPNGRSLTRSPGLISLPLTTIRPNPVGSSLGFQLSMELLLWGGPESADRSVKVHQLLARERFRAGQKITGAGVYARSFTLLIIRQCQNAKSQNFVDF